MICQTESCSNLRYFGSYQFFLDCGSGTDDSNQDILFLQICLSFLHLDFGILHPVSYNYPALMEMVNHNVYIFHNILVADLTS